MRSRRFFSHHTIGYRANPFGALQPEDLTAVAFLPPSVQQAINEDFTHLQLLGSPGCGKTTTLHKAGEQWCQQGQRVAYEYIPEGQHHFDTDLAAVDLFLLDEAQRLNVWQRRRWLKGAMTTKIIFSSHKNLATHFARKNLPLTTIDLDETISLDGYHLWLNNRLAYFALPHMPRLTLTAEAIAWLYENFGKALREAEYFLYEVFQIQWEQDALEVVDLEGVWRG